MSPVPSRISTKAPGAAFEGHRARRNREDCPYNPFVSHCYLASLEEAGCATANTGWLGQHLLLETADGALLGALPCYLKNHSQGEYVFDHGWADAFERAGGRYYPKLQASIPFTPATGPRLLTGRQSAVKPVQAALVRGLKTLTDRHQLSSAHATFVPSDRKSGVSRNSAICHRTDQQFHFHNPGYSDYVAFLETLASRKRKTLKKERRTALGKRHFHRLANRPRPDGSRMGPVLRVLYGYRIAQMGATIPQSQVFFPHRRANGQRHSARHGAPERTLHRRRDQFHRR